MIFRITAAMAASVAMAAHMPARRAAITEVTVTATDFKFDAPASVPAGVVKFTLVNHGTMLHHMVIARLDGGHTMADLQKALATKGPPPAWFVTVGGPNAPMPGGTANATVALDAGNYALLCFVDGGPSDPVPHFAKGMIQPLTVTASNPEKASLPNGDMTLTLQDYGFVASNDFTAGKHTLRVENKGPQEHEIEIVKLNDGKTVEDLMGWLQKMDGPPPGVALGGAAPMAPGLANLIDVDFTPGTYVALCFVPDMKDGAPHFVHGMVRVFTIK